MRFYNDRRWRPPRSLMIAATALALMAVPRRVTEPVRMSALAGLLPVHSASDTVAGALADAWPWSDADRVTELEATNDFLRDQVTQGQIRQHDLQRAVEAAANFPEQTGYGPEHKVVAAVVLPTDASLWRRSLVLAAGRRDGVAEGDIVVWQNHLVGRVADVGAFDCRVQLMTSPGFKLGAMALPPGQLAVSEVPRARMGVVEGTASERARMKWVLEDTDVADGALVVTTGNSADGTPRGLVLGRTRVEGHDHQGYRRLAVEPEIRYAELDTVVILRRAR